MLYIVTGSSFFGPVLREEFSCSNGPDAHPSQCHRLSCPNMDAGLLLRGVDGQVGHCELDSPQGSVLSQIITTSFHCVPQPCAFILLTIANTYICLTMCQPLV